MPKLVESMSKWLWSLGENLPFPFWDLLTQSMNMSSFDWTWDYSSSTNNIGAKRMWYSVLGRYSLSTSHPFEFEWMCYYAIIHMPLIGYLSLTIRTVIQKHIGNKINIFWGTNKINGQENMQAVDFNIGKLIFVKHLILVFMGLVFLSNVTI